MQLEISSWCPRAFFRSKSNMNSSRLIIAVILKPRAVHFHLVFLFFKGALKHQKNIFLVCVSRFFFHLVPRAQWLPIFFHNLYFF